MDPNTTRRSWMLLLPRLTPAFLDECQHYHKPMGVLFHSRIKQKLYFSTSRHSAVENAIKDFPVLAKIAIVAPNSSPIQLHFVAAGEI